MFNINHVAISVTDIERSIEFYKKFGFQEFKSWKAEDGSIKINMLKLNNTVLEIFCYKEDKVTLGGNNIIMKITLIRHAESVYNEKRLLQGQVDCELSKKGLKETKEKSKNFPSNFDICFCSPLKRTKQTAEILVPYLNKIYDERIIERGLGDWENTPNTDEKQFLMHNKTVPPNGETFEEFDNRILDFLEMLKKDYNNKKILIVTHGGVIYAIHRILGLKVKVIENLEMVTVNF